MTGDGALDIVPCAAGEEAAVSPPPQALQFVLVNAASPEERLRNRKVIRSTAMKSFRRQRQSQRVQVNGASSKDLAIRHKTPHSKSKEAAQPNAEEQLTVLKVDSSSEAILPDISLLVSPSPPRNSSNAGSEFEETSRREALKSPSPQTSYIVASPLSILGAGRVDPFRIQSVETGSSSSQIHELLDHSITVLWPAFRPRGSDGVESKISGAWLEKVYARPVVRHALLFGAAVHMDVLRSPRTSLDNPFRLLHKVQTMRLLKEELKSPDKIPLDEVILAVLCLGTNEIETMTNNTKEKMPSPFNSPLTSIQWLDVYGKISHIPAHTIAMRSLVRRRGGLENIELEGLAEVLLFSDVLGATQSLSKPHWSLLERTINSTQEILSFPLRNLGQGFQNLIDFGINELAACVLHNMATLTNVIDCHCRGIKPIPDLTLFIDKRNDVQHSLMSLPTGDELKHGEVGSICLYEAIRHAAIIYSVANVLEESKFDLCWQLCPKVLLWILILGGIAASDAVGRTWYVQNLTALSIALKLSEWDHVSEELAKYLWLESACDAGGRVLWMEVKGCRPSLEV